MSVTVVIIMCLILTGIIKLCLIGRRPRDLPPGPPTIPILGNIHLVRVSEVGAPIWAGIQSYAGKQVHHRSLKMDMYMGQTLASGGLRVLMLRYGPTWRLVRRILHRLLNMEVARSFEPYQALESQQMVYDILKEPEKFTQHARRFANSVTTATTFGYRTPKYEDPHFQELFKVFGEFVLLAQTGVAAILDYLPILQLLPATILPAKKRAIIHHKREKTLYRYHWDKAKSDAASAKPNHSFSLGLFEAQRVHGFSDNFASYITGTLLEAGSDTTSNTLVGFLCAMLLFPDVQRKAQAELDRVVGTTRMPNGGDKSQLPYIRGCIKESARWMPTTILGAVPLRV
ncbi:cytochrome P450 [Xylariaceae sp. FL1019]|nr:cytochrome P450 [Xylariaceae sp. FL1019]